MAIDGTIFAATETEFLALGPSWRRPRTSPIYASRKNPFTGATVQVASWIPDGIQATPGVDYIHELRSKRAAIPPAVDPAGEFRDYRQYLEERTPGALRSIPHAAVKGLITLEPVCEAIGVPWINVPGFVSPAGDQVEELPHRAITVVAKCSDQGLSEFAERWAASDELHGDIDTDGAESLLECLRAVATVAVTTNRGVFYLVEA